MQHNAGKNKKRYIIFACFIGIIGIFSSIMLYHYTIKDSKHNVATPLNSEVSLIKHDKNQEIQPIRLQTYHINNQSELNTKDSVIKQKSIKSQQYNNDTNKKHKKPKVVIIIDDLANERDIKRFESLQLNITLSLFPKHYFSKNNPKIAKTLRFYMVHLPLEAHNFEQQGVLTLRIGDDLQTIESYIVQIKQDFPNISYINNHTGSRYTESMADMQKLFKILDKYNITFVDSLTTSKSVAKELAIKNNKIYLVRNVFLDNDKNILVVKKQLDLALKIADKQGYVIAIGHPNESTYNALRQYKERLMQDYDMIYINELDSFLKQHSIKNLSNSNKKAYSY